MKPFRRRRASSSSSTVTYAYHNDHTTPPTITEIPIDSPPPSSSVAVELPTAAQSSAAGKIQTAYRAHVIRALVKKIATVDSEASSLERLLQRQDTVDAVRADHRERLRINEALMALLLRLDSVPGVDPAVRDLRRAASRRIVALQEIADAVSDTNVPDWDEFLSSWDDAVEGIEEDVCRERGDGEELTRFCVENLGFRCLQRFLRQP